MTKIAPKDIREQKVIGVMSQIDRATLAFLGWPNLRMEPFFKALLHDVTVAIGEAEVDAKNQGYTAGRRYGRAEGREEAEAAARKAQAEEDARIAERHRRLFAEREIGWTVADLIATEIRAGAERIGE